jgi:hypothetical protein
MILLAWACTPADERLTLADAQVVGTHNSYHVATSDFLPWSYDHPPLDEQVVAGIRQFELDLYWEDGDWAVYHLPLVDTGTSCATFTGCLEDLRTGSERVAGHLPIAVLVEPKSDPGVDAEVALAALEQTVEDVLGDRLLRPSSIGPEWPVLEGQREHVFAVLHSRTWEPAGDTLFPDGYGTCDACAFHSLNDPTDPRIPELVQRGQLVRTRTDADVLEPVANDTSRRDAALASGATFLSTDFPQPHPTSGYVVDLGAVARCNPVRQPRRCSPERLE